MKPIKIATAQFENKSGDKAYNLKIMEELSAKASHQGADLICFHECCITGYSFVRNLSKPQLTEISEFVPGGPSIQRLLDIARKQNIAILAGLFEKDDQNNLYNTVVGVDQGGLFAKFRKLHPFIHPNLTPGKEYCVFEWKQWRCGILICYDNNILENVRSTHLLGADILFMPHVTMCTPSTRPGAGFVDPKLWENRDQDPRALRMEFDGKKGREWLMKWLPSRACDNGMYVVFANPIGMDDDQLKNGCSMILDPFGDIVAECRVLGDDVVTATCFPDKLKQSGGYRYTEARRPELYRDIMGQDHVSHQKVIWMEPASTPAEHQPKEIFIGGSVKTCINNIFPTHGWVQDFPSADMSSIRR